ncbi:MAG: hypothetical protein PHW73_00270 [Atribacterota bacterium]|nr:hypothetical protein [Atribacterota bacterium]
MAKQNTANSNQQGEKTGTVIEEVNAQEVKSDNIEGRTIDPIIEAPTIQRDYTQAQGEYYQDVGEPTISAPNLGDEPEADVTDDGFSNPSEQESEKKSSKDDFDSDEYGFKLNGETAVYIVDFLYKLLKERYKISDALLEKHGLSPQLFAQKIRLRDEILTVGDLADRYNTMMDEEVNISADDRKMIKKIIIDISKENNIKIPPWVQLLLVFGKIGLETHLACMQAQMAFIETLRQLEPVYTGRAPDISQVSDLISGKNTDDDITPTEDVKPGENKGRKRRGQYMTKKRRSAMEAEQAELRAQEKLKNYSESGEKSQ